MRKFLNRISFCSLLVAICWSILLLKDRNTLNNELIRFHVLANSDSAEDQTIKISVRDVVLNSIESDLNTIKNVSDAKTYLQENLPKIQYLVNQTLKDLGFEGYARVSLCKEVFNVRHYETFSLPAGVYHSLRIVIGEGKGKNWWCVSFPTLCIPATTDGFVEAATDAGLSVPLTQTLSGNEDYHLRFYFLNQLGKLESVFFRS